MMQIVETQSRTHIAGRQVGHVSRAPIRISHEHVISMFLRRLLLVETM